MTYQPLQSEDATRRPETRNQCDGCARGLPIVNGLHRGAGPWDLQGCTADRYTAPESAAAIESEKNQ